MDQSLVFYLRKIAVIVIVLTLFLVPLVFWHGVLFPYTFVKTILFYALTEVVFAIWIVVSFADKEYHLRVSPVMGALILFLIFMGLASYGGVNISKSLWSDYERMMGFVTWLHIGAFFLAFSSLIRKDSEWRMIWKVVMGAATVVALVAVWQGFTTSDLSISTIGNAAYLSSYLVPVFFLVCTFALEEERVTKRVLLYVGLLFLFVMALIFTEARAGVVGLLGGGGIGFLLFLFFAESQKCTWGVSNKLLKKYGGALALFIFIAAGISAFLVSSGAYQLPGPFSGHLDFSLENRTTTGRFLIWSVAWEGWKERLVFGWGAENFSIPFNTYYKPELYTLEPWFDRAHNFIFDYGSTVGMAGLGAYMGIFGAAWYMIIKKWKQGALSFWHMSMISSLIGAHLIQNFFTFDTISSLLVIVVVLAYASSNQENKQSASASRHITLVGIFTLIIMGTVGYFSAARPLFANIAMHRGWELLRTGGEDTAAIAEFEKGISYNTRYSVDAGRFAAEYVFEFLKQGGKRSPESLQFLMNYAIGKMTENIAAEPENVKWIMYRGELYSLFAEKFDAAFANKAEEDFLRARDMSPGRPQIYLELAQARKMQGDTNAAREYIDYVIRTVPRFSFGHLNALIFAIETRDAVREVEERAWLGQSDELRNEAIRDAYFKAQRYQDAVQIQERIVQFADAEFQTYPPSYRAILYAHLAALYQYANDKEHARLAAYKVLELDPAKKGEVEAFLRAL